MIRFKDPTTNAELTPTVSFNRCGFIPEMLSEDNPAPAKEQLNASYGHGGGWTPFIGFKLSKTTLSLSYPGDPPVRPVAIGKLRDEQVIIYEHAWVAIIQPDGTYEIARMD